MADTSDPATSAEREFQRSASELNPNKGEDNYQLLFANQKIQHDETIKHLAALGNAFATHVVNVNAATLSNLTQHTENSRLGYDKLLRVEPAEARAQKELLGSNESISAMGTMLAGAVAEALKARTAS